MGGSGACGRISHESLDASALFPHPRQPRVMFMDELLSGAEADTHRAKMVTDWTDMWSCVEGDGDSTEQSEQPCPS